MAYDISVLGNGEPLEIIGGHQLTAEQRKAHDYLDFVAEDEGRESYSFVADPRGGDYAGDVHYLGNFQRWDGLSFEPGTGKPHPFNEWDGYAPDSFFSGLLIQFVDEDGERTGSTEYAVLAFYYVRD